MRKIIIWGVSLAASFSLYAYENEEQAAKRVYAHLLIHDPLSAVESGKIALKQFPESKALHFALIRALCEKGDEVEALELWKKTVETYKEEKNNRMLLEVLSWGVLNKGEHSSQLVIRINSLLGTSFTNDARAIPVLLAQMRSSNAYLRAMSVNIATGFGDGPLQEEIARLLKEEKVWYVRLAIIRAVGQLRIAKLRTELKEIIGNPKTLAEEKMLAIISFVNIYENIEQKELKSLARSDRAGLRQLACRIVAHLEMSEGIDEIVPLLKDTSADVRMAAINTFGLLNIKTYKDRPLLELLESNLKDSDPEVAITAAWACLLQNQRLGEKHLEKWLGDQNPELRRLASAALAATGKRGVDLSLKTMKESLDPYVRANLAIALISQRKHVQLACDVLYGVFSSQDDLLMWDDNVNPLFRSLAPSAVKHIEQIPHYPIVVDQMVRLDVLSILSMMRYPKAQEAVKGFLQNQSLGVTGAAAMTLIEEGDEQALDLVRNLLNDPDKYIRVQAAYILAIIGSDPSAVKVLQDAYPVLDREMKVRVLEALAHIGDPQSIPFLVDILNEPFQVLRVVAASALIQCLYH